MLSFQKRHLWTLAAICIVALVSGVSSAQDAADDAPSGAEIMDRYIEASGGKENYEKIENRYAAGTVTIPGMGLELTLEMYTAKPNLQYTLVESEATGTVQRGTNGEIYWEKSVMGGPRILEGEEAAQAMRDAFFDKHAQWRDHYSSAEYVGTDSAAGEQCWVVELTPNEGKVEKLYVSKESNLPVKSVTTMEHQMGEINVEVFMSDYREVDGLKIPFTNSVEIMNQGRSMVFDTLAHNVDMPDSLFEIPDDIKALMEEKPANADTTGDSN